MSPPGETVRFGHAVHTESVREELAAGGLGRSSQTVSALSESKWKLGAHNRQPGGSPPAFNSVRHEVRFQCPTEYSVFGEAEA